MEETQKNTVQKPIWECDRNDIALTGPTCEPNSIFYGIGVNDITNTIPGEYKYILVTIDYDKEYKCFCGSFYVDRKNEQIYKYLKQHFSDEEVDQIFEDCIRTAIQWLEKNDFFRNAPNVSKETFDKSYMLIPTHSSFAKSPWKRVPYREHSTTTTTEKLETHDTLNPILFDDNKEIKENVKDKLNGVVDDFAQEVQDRGGIDFPIKDIVLVGSNVSYNYTNDSDIDLHIIIDDSKLEEDKLPLYALIYDAYKGVYNTNHKIKIKTTPVELYVEFGQTNVESNGIYSLNNGWIKEPSPIEVAETNEEEFEKEFKKWEDRYLALIEPYADKLADKVDDIHPDLTEALLESKSSNSDIEKIDTFLNDLYELRHSSIKKDKEKGIGNQVYKEFRNRGYIKNLKTLRTQLRDKELSMESVNEKYLSHKNLKEGNEDKKLIPIRQVVDELNKEIELYLYHDNIIKDGQPEIKEVSSSQFEIIFHYIIEPSDKERFLPNDIKQVKDIIQTRFEHYYNVIYTDTENDIYETTIRYSSHKFTITLKINNENCENIYFTNQDSKKENMQNERAKQSLKEHFTEKPTSSHYQDIIARPRYYELKEGITFEIKEITPRKFLEGVNTSKLNNVIKLTESLTENKQEQFPLPVIDTTTNRKYGADYVYALSEKYGKNTKFPVMIVKSINETWGDGPAEWQQPYYDTSKADKLSDEELANEVDWEVINTIHCNHIKGSKWIGIDCCMRDESQLINISDYLWVGVSVDEAGNIKNSDDGDSETYDYLSQHKLTKTLEKAHQVANQWCEENGYIVDKNGVKEIHWPSEEFITDVQQEALNTTHNAKQNEKYLLEHNGRYSLSRLPEGVDIELDPQRFKQTGVSYNLDMGNEWSEPLADLVFYGKYELNQDDLKKIKNDATFEIKEGQHWSLQWAWKTRVWLFDLAEDIAEGIEEDNENAKDFEDGGFKIVSSQREADRHNEREYDGCVYITKQDIINYGGYWTYNDFKTWNEFHQFCADSFKTK